MIKRIFSKRRGKKNTIEPSDRDVIICNTIII
jgi:hypothetical protein